MLSKSDEAIPFEGKDEVSENVPGEGCGQGARSVTGLAIRNQRAAPSHRRSQEDSGRVRFRHPTALGNSKDRGLLSLRFVCLFERIRNDNAMRSIGQSLGEPLQQCRVSACEQDHEFYR
jgi:hypothetical protein